MEFKEALRLFATYFVKNYLEFDKINHRTFTSGIKRTHGEVLKTLKASLAEINDFDASTDFGLENFLQCSFHLLTIFSEKENVQELYKEKASECIFHFLTRILGTEGIIAGCNELTKGQLNELRIIHSSMTCLFGSLNNSVLEKMVEERVNNLMDQRFRNLNGNGTIMNETVNDKIEIDRVVRNNMHEFRPIIRLINRKLRYENHIAINQVHLSNKSTPNSLFYNRFPLPFFNEDESFVNKQNKLIERYQVDTLELIKEHLNLRLEDIEDKIGTMKNDLNCCEQQVTLPYFLIFTHYVPFSLYINVSVIRL